ncbi:uncharacterized protein BYT42DRAFT_560969 [Radiomyces spectabilis]|uniref:uncharacterized protein n=1 Tax=Radiomyces spectabilis TaxID=64574 RepID=UPI00221F5857|nr:uncharacterized protein BYT42DRAFT_560969 [Radiomyces spectabilis]KAI8388709.1 hypothetical protein BYT42DRAFT_560969 [Radiomyces spectabilis]
MNAVFTISPKTISVNHTLSFLVRYYDAPAFRVYLSILLNSLSFSTAIILYAVPYRHSSLL